MIASGIVSVLKDHKRVRRLFEGDYFGENAVIENKMRTAHVIAETAVQVYMIDGEKLEAILGT
jgi:CRP-like cAMP-binding protein